MPNIQSYSEKSINYCGLFIKHEINESQIPDDVRNDKSTLLYFIKMDDIYFKIASKELRKDKNFVLKAIECQSFASTILNLANESLKNDKDIILAAVNKDGSNLTYASDELKNDEDIVRVSINNGGRSIRFASDKIRKDENMALAAIVNEWSAFKFISQDLKNKSEFVIKIFNHSIKMFFIIFDKNRSYDVFHKIIKNEKPSQDYLYKQFHVIDKQFYEDGLRSEKMPSVYMPPEFNFDYQPALEYILSKLDENNLNKLVSKTKLGKNLITNYKIKNIKLDKIENIKKVRSVKF